ncbi:HD domain-containing protein [Burkholderia cepacia]|uniref:HD domain-containing protein n=1 Tax=Burkholderia cepacia TaxID=292 RepID=UPI002AB7EF26|nr:HD domain-containing protein [Burkholderia cepacia]
MRRGLVQSQVIVIAFWWIVATTVWSVHAFTSWEGGWARIFAGEELPDLVISLHLLKWLAVMAGVGAFSGIALIVGFRISRLSPLIGGETLRGLKCTLGPLPRPAYDNELANALPEFSKLLPSEDLHGDFYPSWFEDYEDYPAHTRLMDAVIRLLSRHPKIPATHHEKGHGGRSLLQHSLLVGGVMQDLARKGYTYDGVRSEDNKRILLALRDKSYTFNPNDPLIAIIGVAHDVGKIESYEYTPDGKVTGSRHEHDIIGARMLARLPELWGIPDTDRKAILMSCAHYHHPMDLPLNYNKQAADDRTIALMELLIKADRVAGAKENRHENEAAAQIADAMEEETDLERAPEVTTQAAFSAFLAVVKGQIDTNGNDRIGTYCRVKGFNEPLLLLHEQTLRRYLATNLGIEKPQTTGDGRAKVTLALMEALAERNALITAAEIDGSDGLEFMEFSPRSALWNVNLQRTDKPAAKPANWPAVVVVQPSAIPEVDMPESTYPWVATILNNRNGNHKRKRKAPPPEIDTRIVARTLNIRDEAQADEAAVVTAPEVYRAAVRAGEMLGANALEEKTYEIDENGLILFYIPALDAAAPNLPWRSEYFTRLLPTLVAEIEQLPDTVVSEVNPSRRFSVRFIELPGETYGLELGL